MLIFCSLFEFRFIIGVMFASIYPPDGVREYKFLVP